MDSKQWQKVKDVFATALEQPSQSRADFLQNACGEDESLRREVESLLEASDESQHIIEENAFDLASRFKLKPKKIDGKIFGNYRILREIGRGGMGAVFLAERADGQFHQKVALKVIRQNLTDSELERHFRRERQILAALNHPHIARLIDGGVSADDELFLVMEYIEGEPLLEYAERKNLDINQRLNLFVQVCSAVAYAHRNLIVHRDIKPSNILVTKDGEPKLLDFGLAKILDDNVLVDSFKTATTFRAFTPAYASPEQIRGDVVTTASDIYSLGVVLYELLTNHRPFNFKTESFEEIIQAVCQSAPIRPSAAVGSQTSAKRNSVPITKQQASDDGQLTKLLKGDLDNIVLMALRKEPERRYSTVEQFADDIERHRKGLPVLARASTFEYRASKFIERNKITVAAASLIIISILTGLAVSLWQANVARAERDRAARRFNDVRKLSNSLLFELSPKIERLEGSVEARETLVRRALEYLDSLAQEAGDDLSLQSELAAAYEKIGELQGAPNKPNLSDFSGALASFEKAQAIRLNLLEKSPHDSENLKHLAANFNAASYIRNWMSDIAGSLRDSTEAITMFEKVVAENPDSVELRSGLADALINLANTRYFNDQLSEVYAPLQRALKDLETMQARAPDNTDVRRLIGKGRVLLAMTLSWDGKQAEAEAEMETALAICESLVSENPHDNFAKQALWNAYIQDIQLYQGVNDARSLQIALRSLEVAEDAVKNDSANNQARQNLAKSYCQLGIISNVLKKPDDAVSYLEKSLGVFGELEKNEPNNRTYKPDICKVYKYLGIARYLQKSYADSLSSYNKALEIAQDLRQADTQDIAPLRSIESIYNYIADTYYAEAKETTGEKRRRNLESARENYQNALDTLQQMKAQNALTALDLKTLKQIQEAFEKTNELLR